MLRWYFAVALGVLASTSLQAQNTGNTGALGTGSNMGTGSTTGGLSGQVNTTLLGANVNLNFNSVFGTSATLANTNADPLSSYRPSGSVSGSGSGSALGNSFSGTGGGNAFAGGTGTTGNRTNTGMNALGNRNALGGNTTALGGNRTNLGGTTLGGNRNAMGMLGGGLLGGSSFLGGGMNNQQNAITMGYTVNFDGMKPSAATSTVQPTSNVDIQQRLVAAPGMQGASNLQVMMRGETAILRGTVTTDHAKQLAAAMLRLEPGVYEVQNELTVKP